MGPLWDGWIPPLQRKLQRYYMHIGQIPMKREVGIHIIVTRQKRLHSPDGPGSIVTLQILIVRTRQLDIDEAHRPLDGTGAVISGMKVRRIFLVVAHMAHIHLR